MAKYPETRILWAIDPFAKESQTQRNAMLAILALTQRMPACIEPVYVASDPRHQVPPRLRQSYNRELEADAQDELDSWIGDLKARRISGMRPVHVLGPTGASLREQVESLLRYAHEQDADLIVASTRARRGPSRWFFGSFVETLSFSSDLPLLVVNPLWNPSLNLSGTSHFDRILFPTDFSEASHDAFRELISFAARRKSSVMLMHKLTLGLSFMPEAALAMIAVTEEARQAELEICRKKADLWIREAHRKGVKAQSIIVFREGVSVPSAILKQAKKSRSIIALAGESSPAEAGLLGSITRQILRESSDPVWVLHPQAVGKRPARAA